jgi:hypothetical protein
MGKSAPRVVDDVLILGPDRARIVIGQESWFEWLESAGSFSYQGPLGRFAARRERRGGGSGYWKAFRRLEGILRSVYLGKDGDLGTMTLDAFRAKLLEEIASRAKS